MINGIEHKTILEFGKKYYKESLKKQLNKEDKETVTNWFSPPEIPHVWFSGWGILSLIHIPKEVMHQFKVTLDVLTNKEPAELAYVLTQLFKDEALRVQAFSYEEVSERPTTVEHHGGS